MFGVWTEIFLVREFVEEELGELTSKHQGQKHLGQDSAKRSPLTWTHVDLQRRALV